MIPRWRMLPFFWKKAHSQALLFLNILLPLDHPPTRTQWADTQFESEFFLNGLLNAQNVIIRLILLLRKYPRF
jgi:hypothetical protein